PDDPLHAASAQPGRRGVEQGICGLLVFLDLDEPEPAPLLLLIVVEGVVDLRADAPDDTPVAPGHEVLGLAMAEEGVQPAVEEQAPLEPQGGHPQRVVSMQAKRQIDEASEVPSP